VVQVGGLAPMRLEAGLRGTVWSAAETLVIGVVTAEGLPLGTLMVHGGRSASPVERVVLEDLGRAPVASEPLPPHTGDGPIGAVFSTQTAAEVAVEMLRDRGFDDERLGVTVRQGDVLAYGHDPTPEIVRFAWSGIVVGAVVRALAALLMFVLLGRNDDPGVSGMVATGAVGAWVGGVLGAYFGFARRTPHIADPIHIDHEQLEPGQVLVVVRTQERRHWVEGVMIDAGGRLLPVTRPPQRGQPGSTTSFGRPDALSLG